MAALVLAAAARPLAATPGSKRASFRGTAVQVRPQRGQPRTARITQTVSARASSTKTATYICVDCGYIYDGSEGAFEKLPNGYRCPVCQAPKRRFKPYAGAPGRNDQKSMNARWEKLQQGEGLAEGEKEDNSVLLFGAVAGAALLAGIYFFLSAQYN